MANARAVLVGQLVNLRTDCQSVQPGIARPFGEEYQWVK